MTRRIPSIRYLAAVAGLVLAVTVAAGLGQPTEAKGPPQISLPANAVEVAPDVYSLGLSLDNGRPVEGFAIVHRTPSGRALPAKGGVPGPPDGNNDDPSNVESCFSFIFGGGVRWQTAEPWEINPANSVGLAEGDIIATVDAALSEWQSASGAEIMLDYAGTNSITTNLSGDANTVFFGDFDQAGVIAVTWVWRTVGPPQSRQIVAWDMLIDHVDFDFALNGAADKMDLLNIVTHEMGHAVGMGHTDTSDTCKDETMFPTAPLGETSKSSLGVGDEAGVSQLYN